MLRKQPALQSLAREDISVQHFESQRTLVVSRRSGSDEALIAFNFSDQRQTVTIPVKGRWKLAMSSSDHAWDGPGGAATRVSPAAVTSGAGAPWREYDGPVSTRTQASA